MPLPSPRARLALPLLALLAAACGSSSSAPAAAPRLPGDPLTLDVSATFPAGTALRDAYSGRTATVAAGGTVTVTPDPSGVILLERDGAAASGFSWTGATVYFVLTDRFENGDPLNDQAYGRPHGGPQDPGMFQGGDLQGLTARLDHLAALGVNALWISSPVEQVHGWVAGGLGDFKHFGYAGYWALDFTRIDEALGTEADLQALVDAAHQRGIRVLLDVVLNHPGYATGADLRAYLPEVFKDGTGDAFLAYDAAAHADLRTWNDLVNYKSTQWTRWWSPAWIRAGAFAGEFPGFDHPGTDDLTTGLSFLPDFKTESAAAADLPTLFTRKAALGGTGFTALLPGGTPRDHLVRWHTDWVRRFGIDGFRCDTAKNVDLPTWKALKDAGVAALREWKAAHPAQKLDDLDFWMTGEVYGHGVQKDAYYTAGGFDSLLDFDFQRLLRDDLLTVSTTLPEQADRLEALYAPRAAAAADPAFGTLAYLSSHDTRLFFAEIAHDPARQRQAGTALLLVPGGAQIFYGDETGRRLGAFASDPVQGTRSFMNWATADATILAHWQKVGAFRRRHAAVGGGAHARLASPAGTYAFSRKLGAADAVVVVLAPPF